MSSSSARGQTEPIAALIAVFALGIGLSLYVGVLDSTLSSFTDDREIGPTAADRFLAEAESFGVVEPPIAEAATAASPDGYRLNATVRTSEGNWAGGPPRAEHRACADRSISVRAAPGTVRSGRLEVCVWPER